MLFNLVSLLSAYSTVVSAASSTTSTSIGSVVVQPLDYDTYGDTIDYARLRYTSSGEVYFYETSATKSNDTQTVEDAYLLSDGQFSVDEDASYYLVVDGTSGVVSVTSDGSTSDGIFYIDGAILFYEYHSTFIACQNGDGASNYTLIWKSASSAAECQYDWLLVNLETYASSDGQVTDYYPNNYESAVASTATENTATTTTAYSSASSSSSSAGAAAVTAGKVGLASALGFFGAVMSWLL